MAKDWEQYKSEIKSLYIDNRRSLDDVRRILKGRHNFDASERAYRMKIEAWGMKKHGVRIQARKRQKSRVAGITGSSSEVQGSLQVADRLENSDYQTLPTFNDNEAWTQGFTVPTTNRASLSMLAHPDPFFASETSRNNEVYLPPAPNLFETIYHATEKDVLNLLSSGVSVNIRDEKNNSPLHAAVEKGDIAMTKALLKYGADVDAIGLRGKTPLHLAVGSSNLVQLLLKYQPNLSLQDGGGNTILHLLLQLPEWWEGDEIKLVIKSILSTGADINLQNREGKSPLHNLIAEAVPDSLSYMEVFLECLDCKPDVTSQMRNGQPLLIGFLENTGILLLESWHPVFKIGFQCLEKFLIKGTNPNIEVQSQPLLHYCLEKSNLRAGTPSESFIVQLIKEADLDVRDSDGNSPLHMALARTCHTATLFPYITITSELIARQVDVNKPNRAGKTPLEIWLNGYHRKNFSFKKVLRLLLDAGASSMIETRTGKTLFDFRGVLYNERRVATIKMMLEADIESQQPEINTEPGPLWIQEWRSSWKEPLWEPAKRSMTRLERLEFRPRESGFMECAFEVIANYRLRRHLSRLESFLEKTLEKEDVKEDHQQYCAILKDCRDRKTEIDVSFYTFLLEIMDF